MSEETTAPDFEEVVRAALEALARRDLDAAIAPFSMNALWDASAQGLGVFQGREAIRGLLEDWTQAYDVYEYEVEEIRDLGNGVTFVVVRQRGRLRDSRGMVAQRNCHVGVWRDGLIAQNTVYPDIDEARAAAERVAEERGQAITQENLENLRAYLEKWGQSGLGSQADAEVFKANSSLFDPDCAFQDTVLPDQVGETYRGHEGVIRAAQNWAGAYESLLVELEEIVPVGDRLVSIHRVHAKARHTGIECEGRFAYLWTFRGGKVIHFRGYASPKRALKAAGLEE